MKPLLSVGLLITGVALGPAAAQPDSRIGVALDLLRQWQAWTMEQQVSLCEIPAPPFGEARRAAEYRRRLEAFGLAVRMDAVGNVIAERPGAYTGPVVLLTAHLDTVFPAEMDVKVKRDGARLRGLGISDNCRGLAVVLAVARAFQEARVETFGGVTFAGTVGEEGQGDLRGVRHLFQKEFAGRVGAFVSVDSSGVRLTTRGVGSYRYRIHYEGRGGHSWSAFGMPNPAHAAGRAIARIAEIRTPLKPRTTFNVGLVRGGTSVNSVPTAVSFELDLRSESAVELDRLDRQIKEALNAALDAERSRWPGSKAALNLRIETMGVRPAGEQPDSAAIVRIATAAARRAGLTLGPTTAGSTDSNIPISLGIPAVTITGGGAGGGAHSLDEWYEDTSDAYKGPQWAALLAAGLAGLR